MLIQYTVNILLRLRNASAIGFLLIHVQFKTYTKCLLGIPGRYYVIDRTSWTVQEDNEPKYEPKWNLHRVEITK